MKNEREKSGKGVERQRLSLKGGANATIMAQKALLRIFSLGMLSSEMEHLYLIFGGCWHEVGW